MGQRQTNILNQNKSESKKPYYKWAAIKKQANYQNVLDERLPSSYVKDSNDKHKFIIQSLSEQNNQDRQKNQEKQCQIKEVYSTLRHYTKLLNPQQYEIYLKHLIFRKQFPEYIVQIPFAMDATISTTNRKQSIWKKWFDPPSYFKLDLYMQQIPLTLEHLRNVHYLDMIVIMYWAIKGFQILFKEYSQIEIELLNQQEQYKKVLLQFKQAVQDIRNDPQKKALQKEKVNQIIKIRKQYAKCHKKLKKFYKGLVISGAMIGFTHQAEVKVWVNEKYTDMNWVTHFSSQLENQDHQNAQSSIKSSSVSGFSNLQSLRKSNSINTISTQSLNKLLEPQNYEQLFLKQFYRIFLKHVDTGSLPFPDANDPRNFCCLCNNIQQALNWLEQHTFSKIQQNIKHQKKQDVPEQIPIDYYEGKIQKKMPKFIPSILRLLDSGRPLLDRQSPPEQENLSKSSANNSIYLDKVIHYRSYYDANKKQNQQVNQKTISMKGQYYNKQLNKIIKINYTSGPNQKVCPGINFTYNAMETNNSNQNEIEKHEAKSTTCYSSKYPEDKIVQSKVSEIEQNKQIPHQQYERMQPLAVQKEQ